nr:hypothetical protein [uncultured Pluralibacter sp.]
MPEMMTDAQGETVWQGAEHVWVCGGAADVDGSSGVYRCSNFVDKGKLTSHFNKHDGEFRTKTEANYLNIGRDIINHGHKNQYNYKGELGTDLCSFNG